MEGSYSDRQGRKPPITTAALVELILRKLLRFEQQGYFHEALDGYRDRHGERHEARLANPEEYVITHLGRPGVWEWLGDLVGVVGAGRFPRWDEDTLLDVIELFHNQVVSAPIHDEDGRPEGFDRPLAQARFRTEVNQALALRQPPLVLDDTGLITARNAVPPTPGRTPERRDGGPTYDVFISHASEDKDEIARPLAEALRSRGYRVFFDEYELAAGDDLRRKLDEGLAQTRRGILILSPGFFARKWTRFELDALTEREAASGEQLIVPIWHHVDLADVARFSPMLAERLAISSEAGLDVVVAGIERALQRRGGESQQRVPPAGRESAPAASSRRRRPRLPLLGWLGKDERLSVWDNIVIAVIAGAVLVAIGWLAFGRGEHGGASTGASRSAERAAFVVRVQPNVLQGGAAVRRSVDLAAASVVHRVVAGRRLELGGYCLGAVTKDVVTATPDMLWYRLRGRRTYVASSVVSGLPPASLQPERCPGDRSGPLSLRARLQGDGRRVEVTASDAPLVGAAALAAGGHDWTAVGLDVEPRDGFAFSVPAPLVEVGGVVVVSACWAVGAPAHPRAPDVVLAAIVRVGKSGPALARRARARRGAGAAIACGPEAYDAMRAG